jgi:hypothetical protein
MARHQFTVASSASAEQVFAYVADFANTAQWDPGVSSARLLEGDPGQTGARYLLHVSFLGRSLPFEYEVLESIPPEAGFAGRVVLEAVTSDVRSYDVLTVQPSDGGCTVTYDADLARQGLRRPFDPLLRVVFGVIGDRARDGMRSAVQSLARA